jgi:hypothetical protein
MPVYGSSLVGTIDRPTALLMRTGVHAPNATPAQLDIAFLLANQMDAAQARGDQAVYDKVKDIIVNFIAHGDVHPVKAFWDTLLAPSETGPGDELTPEMREQYAREQAAVKAFEKEQADARAAAEKGEHTNIGGLDINHKNDVKNDGNISDGAKNTG